MKYTLLIVIALLYSNVSHSQITITAADMPVAGDTLRYSYASPVGSTISPADSGVSVNWNYPLSPIRQAIDSYQLAVTVNPLYAVTVGFTAYGYKVADSSPVPIPIPGITIRQIYTFFEKKTSPVNCYQAQAFAANISGLPAAFNYSRPDIWYFFPLTYLRTDSSSYALNIAIPGLDTLKRKGYRKTRVDGWGTITTPYYTVPVNCLRVRSEIHEVDSMSFAGFNFGFPVNSVEYKWLVNGDHYPALWVTSNLTPLGENISSIRYRDRPLPDTTHTDTVSAVQQVSPDVVRIAAVPNPAINGHLTLQLPADWLVFEAELYDMSGKRVAVYSSKKELDIHALPEGQYLCRVISGGRIGYVVITR